MAKYRKKPVIVEAELYEPGMEDGYACYDLSGRFVGYYDKGGALPKTTKIPAIKTLEGFHEISEGDWIITGVMGERHPCKPDVFKMTYESADKRNKIIVRDWDYECGDLCCSDYGTDLIINGEEITDRFDLDVDTFKEILKALNVEYELEIGEDE